MPNNDSQDTKRATLRLVNGMYVITVSGEEIQIPEALWPVRDLGDGGFIDNPTTAVAKRGFIDNPTTAVAKRGAVGLGSKHNGNDGKK